MKVGDRVTYKMLRGYTGTVVSTEQDGNTQVYVVEWDDLCPMTGRKGHSSTLKSELSLIQ